jgi:hypothetical protein
MRSIPAGTDGNRDDYSPFVVHLTRDDRSDNGATALANFNSILRERRIRAYNAHCLHGKKLKQLDLVQQNRCKVTCYTETPLDQIKHLTQPIPGRSHNFDPFGFVFHKEFLLENNAQPVTYVNSYGPSNVVREGFDTAFATAKKTGHKGKTWRILPFVSALHERCDFGWEREWRIAGDLKFKLDDLVCVVLPETNYGPLKYTLNKRGIAFISPDWNYSRVVEAISNQKRRTKKIADLDKHNLPARKR